MEAEGLFARGSSLRHALLGCCGRDKVSAPSHAIGTKACGDRCRKTSVKGGSGPPCMLVSCLLHQNDLSGCAVGLLPCHELLLDAI